MNTCCRSALASGQTTPAMEAKHRKRAYYGRGVWERIAALGTGIGNGCQVPTAMRTKGSSGPGCSGERHAQATILGLKLHQKKERQGHCDPLLSPAFLSQLHHAGVTPRPPNPALSTPQPISRPHSLAPEPQHSHHRHMGLPQEQCASRLYLRPHLLSTSPCACS